MGLPGVGEEEELPPAADGKEIARTSEEKEVAFGGAAEEHTEVAFHRGNGADAVRASPRPGLTPPFVLWGCLASLPCGWHSPCLVLSRMNVPSFPVSRAWNQTGRNHTDAFTPETEFS